MSQEIEQLAIELLALLEQQIRDFNQATLKQQKINLRLRTEPDPGSVLDDLKTKEEILDRIRQRTEDFRPHIASWMQIRDEVQNTPNYLKVMKYLDDLDKIVVKLRSADEEMLTLVQGKPQQSQDTNLLIHAFRALS